jgi:hypothetical protein
MSGFDAVWLAQREPFDLAARSVTLERRFAEAMRSRATANRGPLRLLDLGGGTAANFRALAPRFGGDQHWLLCDHDPQLLASATRSITQWALDRGWECSRSAAAVVVRAGTERWTLEIREIDLARDLETLDALQFDGVTTTAFLDLVSLAWLERLASWIEAAARPLLATLTVDGRRRWSPALADDVLIDDGFRRHQAGDKGFGLSLGPGAAQALAELFSSRGVVCETERSDWRIGPNAAAMLRRLAAEAAAVALEVDPSRRAQIDQWLADRNHQIGIEEASLTVGHLDLLALPEPTQSI